MRNILILCCLAPALCPAQDLPAVSVLPDRVEVFLGRRVTDLDTESSYAYLVEKDPAGGKRLIQIYFKVTKTNEGVTLGGLECAGAAGRAPLDIAQGSAACGVTPLTPPQSRDVNVFLSSVVAQNAPDPTDITATGTYSLALGGPLGFKTVAGDKAIFIGGLQKRVKAQLRDDLKKNLSEIRLKFRFAPTDTAPPYDIRVVDVGDSRPGEPLPDDLAGDYIKITLSEFLPSRPEPYRLFISIDKDKLSPDIQRLIDPDATRLTITIKMPGEKAADREHANFFLDLTFSSYVNAFDPTLPVSPANDGARRNVGLFELAYKPTIDVKTWGLNGQGRLQWLTLNPYLTANISTLPLNEAEVPTQIADGVDIEYGVEIPRKSIGLRGLLFTGGPRHESDRDLKFQILTGRFTATPLFEWMIQDRAYRRRVALNQKKSLLVTAYSFKPTFGYEIGDVVRDRHERLIPNLDFQDYISRFFIDFSMMVELRQYFTLSACDTYYYHRQVPRRPNRNYVEAKAEYNTGYLFRRHGLRGLQHSILAKFQRGEQSPSFQPVNVFSIGMSFIR